MVAISVRSQLTIEWEPLPPDFVLPDDPVERNLQPLLAAALCESLELAGRLHPPMLVASNFGLCAKVNQQTVVKAPDWVYIPAVQPHPESDIRRSYTPQAEGDAVAVVMEFISETEGHEYSINPHYPYGKWYFYEQILQVPIYVIFHPLSEVLEVYALTQGQYQQQQPDETGRYWIAPLGLFLGTWNGTKAEVTGCWLRWWDQSGLRLPWGIEQVVQERQRAEQERQRAEQERQRAERLAEQLRQLGVNLEEQNHNG